MPTNYGPQYASSYQKIYDDLKSRYKIGVAALMDPQLALDLAYFQPDGIHPNAKAQPLLLEQRLGAAPAAPSPLVKAA